MKELTAKEEEIMQFFWAEGALFVKQLVDKYPDPKPHFNTLSTYVRALEEKEFLAHESFGTTYRYFPIVQAEEYQNRTLKNVVKKYFNNSYLNVVNSFIKSEDVSIDEIRQLLDEVEKSAKNK
jgi:predicted transcriptional regulator